LLVQLVELGFGISHLLMQGLELTLSFCFEEVVFTLSKEFLL
jgi:hypothetical protein